MNRLQLIDRKKIARQQLLFSPFLKWSLRFMQELKKITMFFALIYFTFFSALSIAHTASITLDHVNPASLIVRSQGNEYTEFGYFTEQEYWVNINIMPDRGYVINAINLSNAIQSSFIDRAEIPESSNSKVYSEPVTSVGEKVKLFRFRSDLQRFAFDECNKNKDLMLREGTPLSDIFARDQIVPATLILRGSWRDARNQTHQIYESVNYAAFQITCSANSTSTTALNSTEDRYYVKKASVQTSNVTRADGTCELAVQVGITTNRSNAPISFQLQSSLLERLENYNLMTDRNGNAIGNYRLKVAKKGMLETGTVRILGLSPGRFSSNIASYSINCPIGNGLIKVPTIKPPQGIPKDGKLKVPSITPLSGSSPSAGAVTPSEKSNLPSIIPPLDIPENKLPKK